MGMISPSLLHVMAVVISKWLGTNVLCSAMDLLYQFSLHCYWSGIGCVVVYFQDKQEIILRKTTKNRLLGYAAIHPKHSVFFDS